MTGGGSVSSSSRKFHSLSVTWIDYRKAYDPVPYNWILEYICDRILENHPYGCT